MKTLITLTFWFLVTTLFSQNAKIDSLQKVIATTKVDTVKGRTLCRLCDELSEIGDIPQTIEKSLEGARILEQQQDHRFQMVCLIHVAKVYRIQGNYPQALMYLQKCLKISEKIDDIPLNGIVLNEIGIIYDLMKDYRQALTYYQKALKIDEQFGKKTEAARMLNNIGIIYDLQGEYNQAMAIYQKGLALTQGMEDSLGTAMFLNNIGMIYHAQGDYGRALESYQKGLRLYEETNDQEGISIAHINLANTYLRLGQAGRAKTYSEKGFRLAQTMKILQEMADGSQTLYQADSALGNWKSAFEYHKLYKQYTDSLHNEDKAQEFGRIESKYQFEKEAEEAKHKQVEVYRKEQIEIERRNNLQYLSIFGGIIALFGVLAFLIRFRLHARVLDIALFAALLILFEFLLILFDPILDRYTGGIPIQKLIFNSVIALGFAPLHGFLEKRLKTRFGVREE